MPFEEAQETMNVFAPKSNPLTADLFQEQDSSGFFETVGASWGMFNPVTSTVVNDATLSVFDKYDPEYEPEEDITPEFDQYRHILLGAKDRLHMERLKGDIRRKEKYENTLARAGGTGVATSLAAGLLDPIGLYTLGAAKQAYTAKNLATLSKAQKAARIAGAGAKTGVAGAGSVALSEAVLQATQPALDASESITAIGGGAILGGILGGGAKYFSLRQFDNLSKKIKTDFENSFATSARIKADEEAFVKNYNSTVGAAQVQRLSLEDLSFIDTFGLAKLTRFINPTLRVMQANSVKARELYANMTEVPLKLQAIRSGKAAPVAAESFAKEYDIGLSRAVRAETEGYKEYKSLTKESGQKPLRRGEYRKRLAQALRRGDVDINEDPSITKAAQKIRKDFLNPMKESAIDAGLLPENIEAKFAESYLTRMWNPKAIRTNTAAFKAKLMDWAVEKTNNEINRIKQTYNRRTEAYQARVQKEQEIIKNADERIAEINSRDAVKFDYRELASVKDDYLDFIKREIGLQELGAYLARYDLGPVAQLVNQAKVNIPKKPESIISAIVKRGGIKPDDELKARGITSQTRVGLYSNSGLGLDVMLRDLIDDGFFPEYRNLGDAPDEFMIDDLRRSIEDDLFRGGVVRDEDIDLLNEINRLEDLQEEAIRVLTDVGIDDYKNFYKRIHEDIKNSKRDLRRESKQEKERIKVAKEAARSAQKAVKPLLSELKRMRNAEAASLRRTKQKAETRLKRFQEAADENIALKNQELARFINANDDDITEYAGDIVDEVTEVLAQVKANPDIPSYITPIASGPLKNKLLDVNDVDFEEFLENDIRHIMEYYRHNMGTQIEMRRKMNEFGYEKFDDWLDDVSKDYGRLVDVEEDGAKKLKLQNERKRVIDDIKDVHDIMLGRYNNTYDPDSVLSQASVVLRDLQFMAKMGGVTISSFPDLMRAPMVTGFEEFIDAAKLRGLSKELKALSNEDLEELGVALESVLASRLQTLADIGDPLNRGTALTRFTGNAANIFSKVTLINYWNDMQKSVSAIAHQRALMKAIDGKKSKEFLLEAGIDDRMAEIIRGQLKKYGDGQRIAGLKNWDIDQPDVAKAQRIWRASIRKISDTAIVTRGAGDLPKVGNTPVGKLFLQFRTFMIASHNRVLLRALQSRDGEAAGVVMASAAMVGLGMMVAATKSEMANRSAALRGSDTNYDTSTWNKRKWLIEGVDRSGLIAMMLEPINVADKAAGLGPSLLTGQGVTSRYGSRNIFGAIAGPSVGTVGDAAVATRALASPITGADVSKSDIYAARRILPFQNAFIFRQMFDILERQTGEALGAK